MTSIAASGPVRTGMLRAAALCAILLAASGASVPHAQGVTIDSDTFGGLEARSIGPAVMSGRIAAIDAVPGDRLTIYVGAASGGVWKSMDGGVTFKSVFDKDTQSIGALAIDRKDPKTVWVGTGETWLRNSVSIGDGVYKSTDGGENWQRLGLEGTERIAAIAIDPKDSNIVFVCAAGHAFDAHPDRGVYRTRDGGRTWEKVLFVDNDTGCGDLAIDPQDGGTLYAGLWQYRRLPWTFSSGGPGSGLYRSTDGGSTWKKSQNGLPKADLGRIGLAVAPSRGSVVYATVEAKDATALYRSDDAGLTWTKRSTARSVTSRPFYFSRLAVDPANPDRLYKMGFAAAISEDGGATFSRLGGSYHGDTHAIWIDPRQPDQLILGTDGGVFFSEDRGFHWRMCGSLPVGQYYHVAYDMEWPYNVYGGLQDNASWYGPSRGAGGIPGRAWHAGLFCDGFWAAPDARDNDLWYAECQGGWVFRLRKSTGQMSDIRPSARAGEPKLRFNWETPIVLSAAEPGAIYFGAQSLFRSRDRGVSWERLSPDLTTNDPAKQKQDESGGLTPDDSTAENHCTIYAIAPSAKNKDLIWVGTDDGNLQVTRDGGKTWTNVAANVPGLPAHTWVASIEASRFDEGTAYAAFDGHMTGDMRTWVFRTTDYGKTWRSIAGPDMLGYAHVVREDLVNPGLLFVGTEMGLWASVDGGGQWGKFTGGLPEKVAVRDVTIHPRDHDLIIATHGRGLYIVDDITPLRGLTQKTIESDVAFLDSRPWVMPIFALDFESQESGDDQFEGDSPGEAAYITYYLKKRHIVGELKLEIYDAGGTLVSTLPGGKRRGINRVEWPMRLTPPRLPPATQLAMFASIGPRVPAGTYTVKMIKNKDTYESKVALIDDPRSRVTAEDRTAQHDMTLKLYGMLSRMTMVVETITDVRDQAHARAAALPAGDALRRRAESLEKAMEDQRRALVSTKEGEVVSGEDKLREELGVLYGAVNLADGRPTDSQVTRMGVLGGILEGAYAKFKSSVGKDLPSLNAALQARKIDPITPLTEDAWKAKQGATPDARPAVR